MGDTPYQSLESLKPQSFEYRPSGHAHVSHHTTHVNQRSRPIRRDWCSSDAGIERVFDEDTFERLVRGRNACISEVSDAYKQRLLDKNIVRLIKVEWFVNMEKATEFSDIPQLAGIKSAFDIQKSLVMTKQCWRDITSTCSCIRFAGSRLYIPLTPVEQIGKGGLRLIRNWQVPQHHRERTGIVLRHVSLVCRWR